MKKINIRRFLLVSLLVLTVSVLVSAVIIPSIAFAAKPAGNLAGAIKVPWNLSADVMPVPPYGSRDIPGSDTVSKLIVNQPNGATEVTITGAMNGLNPDTTYTVYLSKSYTPYVFTGWNVKGTYILRFVYGGNWDHDIVIDVQSDGTFSGTGGYPAVDDPLYNYPYNETITGTIDVMTGAVTIHSVYENSYWYDAIGTIAPDGKMSGTFTATNISTPSVWYSISGKAVKTHTGNVGWPGLFNSATVPAFTFVTDAYGAGSWHVNLRDADFYGPSIYSLSVWINAAGGTMLISDVFEVIVE